MFTYLGWVDHDFGHSTVCPVLLGQLGIGHNWLYRAPKKCLYVVARNVFLLLPIYSAWPSLGPA